MKGTKKGIVLGLLLAILQGGVASAEPSYLIYPSSPTVFRYDASRFELITTGSPNFNSSFAVGSQMLWDRVDNRIPVEIYHAPRLVGFEPAPGGISEFVTYEHEFDIILDGFGDGPRTLGNLYFRFLPEPARSHTMVTVDGLTTDRLTIPLPALEVRTPVDGGYGDTRAHPVSWLGASEVRIIAFSDKNADGVFDGTPLYGIVSHYAPVAVAPATWGSIKALYR